MNYVDHPALFICPSWCPPPIAPEQAEGRQSSQYNLAQEYIRMYGQLGGQSNTMLFNDRPGDVNALLAQATAAMAAAPKPTTTADLP